MDNSTGNEGTGAIWLAQIGSTTFPRLSPTTLDLRPEFATPTKLAFLPMQHAVQRAEQITHVASSVLRIARVTHEENQLLLGTGFYVTDTLLMANDCVRQQSKRSDKYFAHSSPVNVFQEPHQFCVETEVLGSELLLLRAQQPPVPYSRILVPSLSWTDTTMGVVTGYPAGVTKKALATKLQFYTKVHHVQYDGQPLESFITPLDTATAATGVSGQAFISMWQNNLLHYSPGQIFGCPAAPLHLTSSSTVRGFCGSPFLLLADHCGCTFAGVITVIDERTTRDSQKPNALISTNDPAFIELFEKSIAPFWLRAPKEEQGRKLAGQYCRDLLALGYEPKDGSAIALLAKE
eukprot:TRINITY_DN8863_c0_g1_i3.p1 TRINITY_DN8863_c0_g1~~TRINITY_DN8863_c0_g1_i3.p1  ORF type:complete len:349 (-),score=40.84 TRINITY_DN8863_c0_g1_i3:601-1647(-)